MEKPTSIRIPQDLRNRLNRVAIKSNTPATEIILAGLARFLDEHSTTDKMIEAVVMHRRSSARKAA